MTIVSTFLIAHDFPLHGLESIGRWVFTITLDGVVVGACGLVVGDGGRVGTYNLIIPVAVLFGHHVGLGRAGFPLLTADIGSDMGAIGEGNDNLCTCGHGLRHHEEGVAVFHDDAVQCARGRRIDVIQFEVLRAAMIAPGLGGKVVPGIFVDALELDALDGLVP